jgi:O-antigen biosynthesis protein WbqP
MKRTFDILLSLLLLFVFSVPMLLIALLIKCTSKGPVIYWSARVGIHNTLFRMPKFRTMSPDTPEMATHLMTNPRTYLTSAGSLLRKYSLDELPQLWSIFKGDMSFIGPRPALYNQQDLIDLRTKRGVHKIIPGITGWAQVNGRDDIPIPLKVEYDAYYMKNKSVLLDLKILWKTAVNVLQKKGVRH